MIQKRAMMLVASMTAMIFCSAQGPPNPGPERTKDTVQTGCLYVVDPMTFSTKTGYLKRVTEYQWSFEPSRNRSSADTVTLVRTKKAVSASYYLISPPLKTWVLVTAIQDFSIDLTLK